MKTQKDYLIHVLKHKDNKIKECMIIINIIKNRNIRTYNQNR